MRRPRPIRRLLGRPWYRIDLWSALERLHQYFCDLLHLQPAFGPGRSVTLREFLSDLFNLDPARRTSDRPASFKPELTPLELRWLMDARPLPYPLIFAGAGAGSTPAIVAYEADTGEEKYSKLVYAESFTGGVRVAAADFTQDGYPDLLVGPGPAPGTGPNVRVLDGKTGNQIAGALGSFWAFEPWFNGGVNVAAADVDGDTVPDAIFTAGIGGGPRVRVLSGADGHEIANFFALDPDFRGGISVAASDLTGDGRAEIAVGAGEGGGPRVRVYDGATMEPLAGPLGSFFAFDSSFRGGVFVGADGLAGDLNADGTFDLAVSAGPGTASAVKVYSGATGEVLLELSPFGSFQGGVRTALAYVDDDEFADVVVGSGPGMAGTVRVFSGLTGEQLESPIGEYEPFGEEATGGITVAASNDPTSIFTTVWYDTDFDGNFDFGESPATGITVTLSKGGTQIGSGTTDGNGKYTFNGLDFNTDYVVDATAPEGYTSQGPYTVNTGELGGSKSIGLTTGSPPPPPPPLVITGFSTDTGSSNSDRITNDTSLTFTGTGTESDAIRLYRRLTTDSLPPSIATDVVESGVWSAGFDSLAEGTHEFIVLPPASEVEIFPRLDFSDPFTVVLDLTAPTVSLSLDAGATAYSLAPKVWVTVSDLVGFPSSPTVTLDVDLNNDNDYGDANESGYATATMAFGHAVFSGYTALSVGTVKMRARITDLAGNEGNSGSTTVTISSSPNTWVATDRTSGIVSPYAGISGNESSGWLNAGDVASSHALNLALNAAYAKADLVYHSSEANPTPVVQGTIRSDNAKGIPDNVLATLTFDGASAANLSRSGTGLIAGDDWAFALAPSSPATTGRHTYTLDLFIDYPGGGDDVSRSITGSLFVVDRSSGSYGAGWSLSSVDTLYSIASSGGNPAGLLRAFGTGGWAFYQSSGGGYTSPAGDPGTLATIGGGGYRYTAIDGSLREFDSSGRQTKTVSANGSETTTFTLDVSNRLSTITSPDSTVATFAYDVNSRVETITSRSGVATLAYTTGELTAITNPGGGQHTFTYDGSHRLLADANYKVRKEFTYSNGMAATFKSGSSTTRAIAPSLRVGMAANATGAVRGSMTDEVGATPEQAFNTLGQVVGQYGADGGYTTVNRDGNGFITSVVDPLGRRTTYTLDGAGFATQVALPGGGYQTATYDNGNGHHSLLTSTDPLGKTTTYTYTGAGQVETMKDPTGAVTSYTYAAGLLETVTNPLGDVITTVYDSYRRPIGQIVDGQTTGTILYDTAGYFGGRTDPFGNTTTITNDAAGRPIAVTTPDGATVTTAYDAGGLVLSQTTAGGVTTSYAYDSAGRTTEVILGYGSGSAETTTAVYDAAGRVLAVVDPLGNRTTTTYDGQGRAVGVTDPFGNSTRTVYDLNGRIAATVDQLGRTTRYGYDTDGRPVSVTDPLGNTTTTVYDTAGRAIASVDPLGNRTTAVYDAAGRMIATVDPLENRSTTVYDTAGRVIASIDPLGNRTTTVYDDSGRVWATEDAFGNRTTNIYDAASRLVATTDPLNHTSTTVYDSVNRVIASVDPLGNRSTTVYDAAGRFSASVDALGNRTTTVYDALGRVSATIDALGNRTTSVYDGASRAIASVDPFGYRNTSVYDAADRVIATVDPLNNRSTTTYNAAGEVTALTDPLGRLTAFAYDGDGHRTTVVDPLGNIATTVYDNDDRVSARIDPLNNRTTTVYDAADRVSAVINALNQRSTSAYDAAGNRITSVDALNRTSTTVYDALNRAIAVLRPENWARW